MATLIASSWDDVQAQHTLASDGDTIEVTAGSYTVTSTTTITKAITLIASGTVNLTDSTPNASNLLELNESTEGYVTLDGFNFIQGTANHTSPNGVITLDSVPSGLPAIIVNCTYVQSITTGDFIIARTNRGVISGNQMIGAIGGGNCLNNASFVRHKPSDSTWDTVLVVGADDTQGDQLLYIETNDLLNVQEAYDGDDDSRAVIRYNTLSNSTVLTHGADTSLRGGRFIDFGYNTCIRSLTAYCTAFGWPTNLQAFFYLRGGTAYIHDNAIPAINDAIWGDKPEIYFTVMNLRRAAGVFSCWSEGYPSPRQPGWGWITGSTEYGTTGVYGDLQPIYLWNNTGTGNYDNPALVNYSPNECGGSAPEVTTFIQSGREYHTSTPAPGYTSFTYPHPLLEDVPDPPPVPPESTSTYSYITLAQLRTMLAGRLADLT